MKEHLQILKGCALFKDLDADKLLTLLKNLNAREKTYKKNQIIYSVGDKVDQIGIVISGAVHIEKTDIDGNKNIIIKTRPSQTFGETLAFGKIEKSPIDIIAAANCLIVFIPVSKIIEICLLNNEFSADLIVNTSRFVSQKSMLIHIKMDILAQKSIRAKLLSYFYYESGSLENEDIEIPFSREGLADYLSVNPSALSRELGKMRDEGMISFKRNRFTLLNKPK